MSTGRVSLSPPRSSPPRRSSSRVGSAGCSRAAPHPKTNEPRTATDLERRGADVAVISVIETSDDQVGAARAAVFRWTALSPSRRPRGRPRGLGLHRPPRRHRRCRRGAGRGRADERRASRKSRRTPHSPRRHCDEPRPRRGRGHQRRRRPGTSLRLGAESDAWRERLTISTCTAASCSILRTPVRSTSRPRPPNSSPSTWDPWRRDLRLTGRRGGAGRRQRRPPSRAHRRGQHARQRVAGAV